MKQSSLLQRTRVGFSDIHPNLFVVSPWWNRLDCLAHGLGSSMNQIQGWTIVRESCSRALEQRPLPMNEWMEQDGNGPINQQRQGKCTGNHAYLFMDALWPKLPLPFTKCPYICNYLGCKQIAFMTHAHWPPCFALAASNNMINIVDVLFHLLLYRVSHPIIRRGFSAKF